MKYRLSVSLFLVIGILSFNAFSDEGMYPLDGVSEWPSEQMKKSGLEIAPEKLLELRKAVAKVASGGSGSFVSDQGLLVTNHHVAYRCIAALDGMDEHKGIMADGFVAEDKSLELPCPGYDLMVVEKVLNVTDEITGAIGKTKGHKRFEVIRKAKEKAEQNCQDQNKGMICEAEALDGGRFYHVMVYRRIKDVRLVYAPEEAVGKFGGDVDNWMYPRHTGDYSFLRAYVNKNGEGVAHHSDNIPFESKSFLKVSSDGIAKGDFIGVIGFPARTKRNFPAAAARFEVDTAIPMRRKIYGGMIDIIKELSKTDDLSARRYQGLNASLNNAVKYYGELSEGFTKWEIPKKRLEREKATEEKIKGDPRALRKFKKLVKTIDKIHTNYSKAYTKHFIITVLGKLTNSVSTAGNIAQWTKLHGKPDLEIKEPEFKSKNVFKIFAKSDNLDNMITIAGERALLTYIVEQAGQLPPKDRVKAIAKLLKWGKKAQAKTRKEAKKQKKSYDDYYQELTGEAPSDNKIKTTVALLFAKTTLIAHDDSDAEKDRALFQRRRLFYNDPKEVKKFKDPLLAFARDLTKEKDKVEKGPFKALEENFDTDLRPQYANAIGATYPDANFQVRFSFGTVDDYTATVDGKVHSYLTTASQVLTKEKGEKPFIVPDKLKEAMAGDKGRFVDSNINDVPVNFTTTLDTTGGNSGSAVIDSKGRLVGLLFDGTTESILSDWQFLPDDQRSICLDIRYALFLADKVHNAANIISELGL